MCGARRIASSQWNRPKQNAVSSMAINSIHQRGQCLLRVIVFIYAILKFSTEREQHLRKAGGGGALWKRRFREAGKHLICAPVLIDRFALSIEDQDGRHGP